MDNPNRKRNTITYWECVCDCGNITYLPTSTLAQRNTKSCGCGKFSASNRKHVNNTCIPTYIFIAATRGASMRNIEFDISIEDIATQWIKQHGICALSGMKLFIAPSIRSHKIKEHTTASLDRIDSSKGYTTDNIQWIHKDINIMKNNFSEDYFIGLCGKIAEHKRG